MTKKNKSPKNKKLKFILGNLLAMVIVVIVLLILTFQGLDKYTRHNQDIPIPDLKGMSSERAKLAIESLKLEYKVADSGYMPQLPPNSILDQSVKAGHKVKEGRLISVTVNSSTAPTIVVPDLADNSSLREAQSRLQAIGLALTPTEYINGEKDWVYEVKCNGKPIAAGTRISITSKITLVAGDGLTNEDFMFGNDSTDASEEYGEEVNFDDI